MTGPNDPLSPERRDFVARLGRWAAVCCCGSIAGLAAGCNEPGSETEAAGPLRVPLDDLPVGKRTRYMRGDRAVELVRTFDGVRARSLLCTHQGCNVRWIEDQGFYLCPCHDGRFDAQGQPLYGPPREPLRDLNVTVTETEVIVDG